MFGLNVYAIIGAVVGVLVFGTAAYQKGRSDAEASYNIAVLEASLAAVKADLESARHATARAKAEAEAQASAAATNATILKEIADAAKDDPCRLSDDDARRLRDIR